MIKWIKWIKWKPHLVNDLTYVQASLILCTSLHCTLQILCFIRNWRLWQLCNNYWMKEDLEVINSCDFLTSYCHCVYLLTILRLQFPRCKEVWPSGLLNNFYYCDEKCEWSIDEISRKNEKRMYFLVEITCLPNSECIS